MGSDGMDGADSFAKLVGYQVNRMLDQKSDSIKLVY